MKLYQIVLILLYSQFATAQENSAASAIVFNGYIDSYYAAYTDELEANQFQQYTTTSPRDNRFGLNIIQVGAAYNSDRIRAAATIHYGDIAAATWSEDYNEIQQANVGIRLAHNLWIDAGFFTTHIGTESFLPKNNWTTSTVVATYNEPFYQAGARISYDPNKKLHTELWIINGYNQFVDVNDPKSVGFLINYNFTDSTSLTYTNLLGRESLDDSVVNQFRTYHNFYLNTSISSKMELVIGGDLGTQTNSKLLDPIEVAIMYNALIAVRYQIKDQLFITTRGEVFQDPDGFISGIPSNAGGSQNGLEIYGTTLSLEYQPSQKSFLRLEGRMLNNLSDQPIFNSKNTDQRWEIGLNLGIVLDHEVSW